MLYPQLCHNKGAKSTLRIFTHNLMSACMPIQVMYRENTSSYPVWSGITCTDTIGSVVGIENASTENQV